MAALIVPLSLSELLQRLQPDTLADLISQAMRAAGQGNIDWVFLCGEMSDRGNSQWEFRLHRKDELWELGVQAWG